jgi:hypothetical protein
VREKLLTHLEVAAILRRTESDGDFATVLRKGDRERGSLLLLVGSRGRHHCCLERVLDFSGGYHWQKTGPADSASAAEVSDFLAKRARFDADLWAIELDVALPERFIAETTGEA